MGSFGVVGEESNRYNIGDAAANTAGDESLVDPLSPETCRSAMFRHVPREATRPFY